MVTAAERSPSPPDNKQAMTTSNVFVQLAPAANHPASRFSNPYPTNGRSTLAQYFGTGKRLGNHFIPPNFHFPLNNFAKDLVASGRGGGAEPLKPFPPAFMT